MTEPRRRPAATPESAAPAETVAAASAETVAPTETVATAEAVASSEVNDEDLAAARRVREGVVRLARRMRARRQEHSLGPTGIALLSRLYRDGEATPKALADAEDAQPQTLTRVIAALEEQGLVARRADPSDGRQVLLNVTIDGRRLLQRHAAAQTAWLAGAMVAELSEPEREIVRIAASLLERLADHRP